MRPSSVSLPPRSASSASSFRAGSSARLGTTTAQSAKSGGTSVAAKPDSLLLEAVLRTQGLQRFTSKLVQSGLKTVGDVRRRGRLLPALLPEDVARCIVKACGIPASRLNDDAADADGDDTGAMGRTGVADPHDAAWCELRRYEEEAEEVLRGAAARYSGAMLGSASRSLLRRGCTTQPRRSEADVARAAVDRAKAQLALVRSAERALRELRDVEAQTPGLVRRGKAMDLDRHGVIESLADHVRESLTALALQRQHWRDAPDAHLFGASATASKGASEARDAASAAETASLRREVTELRTLLHQHGVDASHVEPTPEPLAQEDDEEGSTEDLMKTRRPVSAAASSSPRKDMADWVENKLQLPIKRNDAVAAAARKAMFRDFDPNGNGYLSLAEIDKAARDVLKLPGLFDAKPVLLMAYKKARNCGPNSSKANAGGDDDDDDLGVSYVERREFRMLLLYIAAYYDLWAVFKDLATADSGATSGGGRDNDAEGDDVGDDKYLDLNELRIAFDASARDEAGGVLAASGVASADAAFAEMNTDGGSKVSFREFADWALTQLGRRMSDADRAAERTADTDGDSPPPEVAEPLIPPTPPPGDGNDKKGTGALGSNAMPASADAAGDLPPGAMLLPSGGGLLL